MKNRFEERYRTGDLPWDHGVPDANLTALVARWPIEACKALDVGCGKGDNAIWLARQHFVVTGCDLSPTAIRQAAAKAAQAGVTCTFLVADFLRDPIPGAPFGFVFDRGCLHTVGTARRRRRFAANAASHLAEGGFWLTLAGNADDMDRAGGPPRLTATELVSAVEPYFEVVSLAAGHFGGKGTDRPRAWLGLLRKRGSTG